VLGSGDEETIAAGSLVLGKAKIDLALDGESLDLLGSRFISSRLIPLSQSG